MTMYNILGAVMAITAILPFLRAQPNTPPRFIDTQYTATLDENKPVGTNVLQVSAVDNDRDQIMYELGNEAAGRFKINLVTGQITSLVVIDREALSDDRLDFKAYAYDNVTGRGQRVNVPVSVVITDVNDNKPVFIKTPYNMFIQENVLGSTGFAASATDADNGRFALITYSITGGNAENKFGIGPYTGTVSVIESVDYETKNNYTLTITATDGGGLTAVTSLDVEIRDVDDLPAIFSPSSYSATTSESASKGVYVTTVTARDGDLSLGAPVSYLVDQDTNPDYAFAIIQSTGVITVNNTLDREKVPLYSLRVGAKSTIHKAVFATVTITISDVNDNVPRFTSAPYRGSVPENSPTGLTVLRVSGQDADLGNNAVFEYSLVGAASKFIVTSAGDIVVSGDIDRETQDTYSFEVKARERLTSERYQATAQVTINVTDVNDNNPQCVQAVYKRTLKENQPNQTEVVKITVTDADIGFNADIRFSLVPDSSNHYKQFSIDPISGVLKTMTTFDREELGTYNLIVRVTDQPVSGQGRIGECAVVVTIGDVNDNSPVLDNLPNTTDAVSEGAVPNTPVFTVLGSDLDAGINAAISYSIISGNDEGIFAIQSSSGVITTVKALDRESVSNYTLGIQATDGGGKSVTSFLILLVQDVNDNKPVFSHPGGYAFAVNEGSIGLDVGTVKATDRDEGSNAYIVYSLKAVEDYTKFTIDGTRGIIKTASILDREAVKTHSIQVLAQDSGFPRFLAEVGVTINVTDINDHRPKFGQRRYTVTVLEKSPPQVILTVLATDADLGINAHLSYVIESGNLDNSFVINRDTGVLATTKALDREQRASYSLLITVSDLHGNEAAGIPLKDSAIVEVTIQDINDNKPLFSKSLYSLIILENVAIGKDILKVQAIDLDEGRNRVLYYSIVSGNSPERFFIDASSGVLYVKSALDRDPPRSEVSFNLKVMVTDAGNSSLNSTTTVAISVSDVNDSPPEFTSETYTVYIPENITSGTVILQPSCVDRDLGTNGKISYSISSGNEESPVKFVVDLNNGRLSVSGGFDYDVSRKKYNLVITAKDSGQPSLTGNVTVIVNLENINDNTPVFSQREYLFTVQEGSYINNDKAIGKVTATDSDNDSENSPFGQVIYSFINQSSYYRDHHWPLTTLDNGLNTIDISGGVTARAVGSATIEADPYLGHVISLSGSKAWIRVGDFAKQCISDPSRCADGLTVAFWLLFHGGRYIISSGGQSQFGSGFAFYYTKETGKYSLLLATFSQKWKITLDSIPLTWFYATFTWNSQSGLRYYENGLLVQYSSVSTSVSRASDAFTILSVGLPNNIDKLDYYGNLSISDLMIWKKELMAEEVLHSYRISRHVTGKPMPTLPQYVGSFDINPATGEIKAIGLLDRETKPNYTLDVAATDMDPVKPRRNTSVVLVEILDTNDNAPVFSQESYVTTMAEHSAPGHTVIQVHASDKDSGTNSNISYSIVSGNTDLGFTINSKTGVISPAKDIDREKIQQYLLGVQARDGGIPSLQATVQVTINIEDINDNTPVITPSTYSASVLENKSSGQVVLKLSVLDPDHLLNGQIAFTVNSDKFVVNDTNGELLTTQELDREIKSNYDLTITAKDKGSPARSSSIKVRVTVLDENDNVPQFTKSLYQALIVENMTLGSYILQVSATDPDQGSNGDIAYSIQGSDGIFVINETSGVISVISLVDREARPGGFSLIVTARDHGYPKPNVATARVNITVSDINDNTPRFDKFTYMGVVREDSDIGAVVVEVRATDNDDGLAGMILYSITGGNPGGLFAILNTSGNITVAKPLDRETRGAYELQVTATDRGAEPKSSTIEVDITITDANDNRPSFINVPSNILVSESALSGTPVFTVIATDKDLGINSQVSYSGYSPEGKFVIDAQSGVVKTVGSLDYEDVKKYVFYVIAMDTGIPQLNSTTLQLNITIVDSNDNNPQFTKPAYGTNISEAAQIGDDVIHVSATEKDSGLGSVVSYNISAGDPGGNFVIDHSSGQIKVKKSLDRESQSTYNLLVTAKDGGTPPRFGQATVIIRVIDVNDRPPTFKFTKYQKEFPEDTAVGSTVLKVEALDEDTPDNTQLIYTIVDGQIGGHFVIATEKNDGKYTGVIKVAKPLDRETTDLFNLNVSVSDGLHTGYTTVELRLSDVNDRKPEFNSSVNYTAEVTENTPGGLLVIQVTATDEDLGSSAVITYSIAGTDGRFVISEKTGEIRTSSLPLNRETKSFYILKVTATDKGGNRGFTDVFVRVIDKNDNSPVFNPSSYTVTLTEGPNTSGMFVTSVNATDGDEGMNQLIEYSIVSGNIGDVFTIDSRKGEIQTAKNVDREAEGISIDNLERGVYRLTIRARDHGNPAQSSTAHVTVQILDINDNPPVFPPKGYKTMISEGAKANQDVIAALATDKDAGKNRKLKYELISGNTGGDFTLDPDTGMIKTARNLEREQTFLYNLTIGAADQGKPSFSKTTRVEITVGDINDNSPVFKQQNYSASVYENSPVGTHLVNVKASDADNGQNAYISYSITSGDPMKVFGVVIKATHGELVVRGNVDREVKDFYNLTITASDGGVPISRHAEAFVLVTIFDRNDNSPQFSSSSYLASIDENSGPGTPVQMVSPIKATDRDTDINAEIRYHLNGTEASQFTIDPLTGVITTRSTPPPTLDHEGKTNYTFHVVAVDRRGTAHASFARVTINILDTNDNTPIFNPGSRTVTISESSPIGYSVTIVTATDPDSDINGRIFYSINSGSEGKFEVGRVDGVIRVSAALDRETKEEYILNISAIDGSYYPNEGYGTVIVKLQDINDNKPMFTKPVFSVSVSEGVPVGTVIVNVTAFDSDFGTNALLTYRMNHQGFRINAQTGSLSTTQKLDRETTQIYSFMVTARDGGGIESSASVNVEIGDENDNSPQFPTNQYQTDIRDKTSVGTIVLSVKAEDHDAGENGRVTYSIVTSKDDLFAVEPNTGLITVVKSINRLQLAQTGVINANGSFIFKIQARDHGISPRSSNVTVVINIIDLGDDSPVFNSSSYLVNIRENQSTGTQVVRLRITKQRPGTTLTYSIVSLQNAFTIDKNTGVISTTASLDRETRDYYILTARATDNGQTPLSGYTSVSITPLNEVVIHVTDNNDNAPEFQFPAPYKMTAREDSPLGTNVGRVKALDKDEGDNGEFEYAITHANIGPGLKIISINKECATPLGLTNGDIRASDITATSSYTVPNEDYSPTQGRLNNKPFNQAGITYKGAWCASSNNEQQYLQIDLRGMRKVTKIATQGRPGSNDYVGSYVISYSQDGTQYTQQRTVFIGNSDAESIQVNFVLPAFHARYVRIHPQSWIGRICMRVELYGCESTGKDEVTLPFIIEPFSGYINTSAKLDREQQNVFTLIIQAKDKGSPPLNSSTTVEISISDTNDNKPVFRKSVYHASVPENAYGGYQVIRVTATDADIGTNAQLKYIIVNGGDGRFIIEDTSGIIRPSGYLDYDSMPIKFFVLNISASDGGQPQFSSTTLVNISVTDFNDNKPVFNSSSYSAEVIETASVGDRITTVTAMDMDAGINALIVYSLSGDIDTFKVVPNTGEIRLTKSIDRENKDQYKLTITASDGGTPTLSSKTHLTINVLDVNDNPPVFTSRVYARTMSEGVAVGTIVITVQANDADVGVNGRVIYQILHGNADDLFKIDDVTGAIRLAKPLNRETNATIKLTVLAKDQGKDNQFSEQAEVEIVVTDVNDNAPVIRPRQMTASVPENSIVGTFVLDVNATDEDIDYNGHVTYAIMHGGDGRFIINSTSGVVRTAGNLDRETKDLYTLIVMARDQGSIPYMDFGTIDVHVIDMNDNLPLFTSIFGPFSVLENQATGKLVGRVSATDKDIGSNAALTYGISAGPGSTDFTADSKTGEIFTAKALDREAVSRYDLTVSVTNNYTSPQRSSSTVVRINVLDLNDKTPEFVSRFYNKTISEASPSGTHVVTVSAFDKDEGTNGRILYRIRHDLSSSNSDVFNINAVSGSMTLQVLIDDYEYRSFTVMVEAKDMASSQALSSVVPVYVIIDDVNDNSPVFSNKLYSVQTSESTAVGTAIAQISASDNDIGPNGKLTYKLISGNEQGIFRINSSSGFVIVNSPMDRETNASYKLIAGAFNDEILAFNNTRSRRQVKRNVDDSGHLYDTTQVNIVLLDVNDNAPVFIRPLFVGGIPEGAELNTYIITISATDADAGNFSVVSYRIKSGNEAGYFSLNTQTGQIFSASLFQNKKGQRFTLQIDAFDNNGRDPSNQVSAPALVRIFVLLEEQRVTLRAEVSPTLIEENRDEFVSVLSNITEAEVYIEQVFKVDSINAEGEKVVESKVVFHAVKESTQRIMTSDEVIRTIDKYRSQLETMYAKWKIKADTPRPRTGGDTNTISDAVLALIILGSLVVLLLIIILICVIKSRCSSEKQEMHRSPAPARRFATGQHMNRATSWSSYDDVVTIGTDKDITTIRMKPERDGSFNSTRSARHGNTYASYLLNKKRLSQSADDKIWSEGDYYLQDSKTDSYLDDDGGSNKSDVSRPSTSRSPRDTALAAEGMPNTMV